MSDILTFVAYFAILYLVVYGLYAANKPRGQRR